MLTKMEKGKQHYSFIATDSHPLDRGADVLREAQQSDPSLKGIRDKAIAGSNPFVLEDGLLYRRNNTEEDGELQLILPNAY